MALEDIFPNLATSPYRVTSPAAREYNCIAWAAGKDDSWWEPIDGYYWPPNVPRDGSIASLRALFEALGFLPCTSSELEPGFVKVAIYGIEDEYSHAARQLPDGCWTSKLGPSVDIEHESLDSLVGAEYGRVAVLLRRATQQLTR